MLNTLLNGHFFLDVVTELSAVSKLSKHSIKWKSLMITIFKSYWIKTSRGNRSNRLAHVQSKPEVEGIPAGTRVLSHLTGQSKFDSTDLRPRRFRQWLHPTGKTSRHHSNRWSER